ncbi:hypothetical protein OAE15_02175, partial [Verrucomicrobiales bacterium]|nr:hypothetical protein [Verrucomicrobiales bacterium]
MHTTTLQELAELTEAKLLPGTVPLPETIEGFADLMSATETDVSFYGNAAYLPKVRKTKAAAVFVPHDFDEPMASARLIVENPSVAFAIAVDQLSLPLHKFEAGIHPSAQVHPTAQVDTSTVCVDAGAVIAEGVCVGAGSYIGQGVSLDRGVSLGDSCQILANASIREHCLLG